ncbi:MAG: TonB-dependent receptor, partial [bacterium]|nr:TonB-dependent receptor [bacterium]
MLTRTWPAIMLAAVLGICLPQSIQAKDVTELEEVVVTGTKSEKLLVDVPVRTEVISSKDIEAKGATNLYEALEGTPGIRVEQQCSYCFFTVCRMQGLEAGHVQILIDGQPVYSGLASVYGLSQVPTSNIERIEVVKGAGSALYGASAIAGVINIITKKASEKPAVKAGLSFGEDNTNNYEVFASTKKGNMDVMITAQKTTGDEILEKDECLSGEDERLTDRVRTDNTAGGVNINWYNLFGDDKVSLSGRALNELRQGGDVETFDNFYAEAAENITTTRYEAEIGYKKNLSEDRIVNLNLSYTTHDRVATNDSFVGDYLGTHDDEYPPVNEMRPYLADELLYVADLNYACAIGEKHRLLAGAQYSRNTLEEAGKYVIVDEEDPDYSKTYLSTSKKSADEVGLYLQDEIFISDSLELVAGARYDSHKSEDDFGGSGDAAPKDRITLEYDETAFSPRAALMYRPNSRTTIRTSFGTGFRVPYGFSEDLHLCSGSPRIYKGAGLGPEKSASLNLGVDYAAERYSLSANIFRTNLKDKIGFADASEKAAKLGYTYEWENIADAYTQGVELGLTTRLAENLGLDCNLAYTDAQYDKERDDWVDSHAGKYAADSKHIPRVPDITAGVKLDYNRQDWNLVLDCNYTGGMYIDYCKEEEVDDPESKIKHTDPFVIVNAKASKSLPAYGLTAFIGAKNLTDVVQDEKHPDDAAFILLPRNICVVRENVTIA